MKYVKGHHRNFNADKLSVMTNHEIQNSQSSLYSLLKYFDLGQYFEQLLNIGFTDENPQLQFLEIRNRRKFTNQMNLMPGHNNRFLRMFSKLEKMAPREGMFQNQALFTERSVENFENYNLNTRQVCFYLYTYIGYFWPLNAHILSYSLQ